MFNSQVGSCDLYHCGITRQSYKQVKMKFDLFNKGGMPAIKNLWEQRVRKGIF